MLEIRRRFYSENFYLFIFFVYLVRFNTNKRRFHLSIFVFTEDDGTTINNEDKIILNKKCLNIVSFKELSEKSAFLKIPAQVLEAGDFYNIF